MSRPISLLLTCLGVAIVGCGSGSPQDTLRAYAVAVEDADAPTAYQLLSADFRARVDASTFQTRFADQEGGRDDLISALDTASGEAAFVEAHLPYSEFDTLDLTLTGDGWRIDRGLFNFYGQRTPREALYSFIKAVERRKYPALMRFVPNEYAAHMSAELIQTQFEANPGQIDEMIALLRQNKDNLITQKGKTAWMAYGPYRVDFLQEDGAWKIADPD